MIRLALALVALLGLCAPAIAQPHEHHHPTETIYGDQAKFYETWMRPDVPTSSCCSMQDCYATPARMVAGKVQALHRESGEWIEVPAEKVEQSRVSPDGRNHLCASSYKFVFCFVWGGGT
jgi:hypothetical protein